jgi:hypothetical protein
LKSIGRSRNYTPAVRNKVLLLRIVTQLQQMQRAVTARRRPRLTALATEFPAILDGTLSPGLLPAGVLMRSSVSSFGFLAVQSLTEFALVLV